MFNAVLSTSNVFILNEHEQSFFLHFVINFQCQAKSFESQNPIQTNSKRRKVKIYSVCLFYISFFLIRACMSMYAAALHLYNNKISV